MNAFFIICAAAALAFVPVPALQAVLATAASTLFESTPFILAGVLLAGAASRRGAPTVLLGCGCSGGPGALALPVFTATLLTLGPIIAVARWLAALAVSRLRPDTDPLHAHSAVGSDLFSLLPYAIASGVFFGAIPLQSTAGLHPVFGIFCAAVAAFCASPCGFGAIALAVTLHRTAPLASAAVLCIAGVCDLRALRRTQARAPFHDAPAYAIAAAACFLLAWHRGNTLVNPRFIIPLFFSAAMLVYLAWRYRTERAPLARWAPALMLAMSILSAPPPAYFATETTLGDAFAGEALTFRGVLASASGHTSLVRYAVTCCRADAQPVSVRLTTPLRETDGAWISARGRLVTSSGGLALRVERYDRVAAPADPFLYR
ncbi:MAG: hypothetical protein ABR584_03800 [Candidatus Baltobacteraceae bacterium]